MNNPTNNKSRNVNACGKVDRACYEDLIRYGNVLGIGKGKLATLGVYLIVDVMRDFERELRLNQGKNLEDVMPYLITSWRYKYAWRQMTDMISKPNLPTEIRDEIITLIAENSEKLKNQKEDHL